MLQMQDDVTTDHISEQLQVRDDPPEKGLSETLDSPPALSPPVSEASPRLPTLSSLIILLEASDAPLPFPFFPLTNPHRKTRKVEQRTGYKEVSSNAASCRFSRRPL